MQLHIGTTLQGSKYRITEFLGQGGFGITYLAIQSGLERKVAIKEFFMKELCERDESTSHVTLGTEGSRETVNRFREKFLKEARNIARLNHPNIVRIIDVFEENGTAYYVMEYAEGGSLADKVKREGNLSESVATCYILLVAHALDYIHERKMNHLDVKPANIMLNEKNECVLIDFGLSKQYDESGSQTSTTPVGISEGYAPMEQYMQGGVGEFSPETDIYALGATFYKLLTGITPPNASFVNNEGLPLDELKAKGVSNKAISAIVQAMEGRKRDRMKSVRTFIDGLDTTTTSSAHKSSHDEEATLFTSEMQRVEAEREAAEQGDAVAQYKLGVCYEKGQGVKQSYSEAVRWYRKAAKQGDAIAQLNLGVCYEKGQGVKQSYTEAAGWYREAAERGNADAQTNLGICYCNGQGLGQSYSEAVKWFRKAAEQGHARAQYNLGVIYENGEGVRQSYTKAARWYREAAERGNADAQTNLGLFYCKGLGVKQSYTEAVKWYRKAAEQGDPLAEHELSTLDDEATLFNPEMQRVEAERKRKEAETKDAREKAEARAKAEAERKNREEEERKKKTEEFYIQKAEKIKKNLSVSKSGSPTIWVLAFIIMIGPAFLPNFPGKMILCVVCGGFYIPIAIGVHELICTRRTKQRIKRWKLQHPDDPVCKYL